MMKPLLFMGYTTAPDPMLVSLFLVWRVQITPTGVQPYFVGANPSPRTPMHPVSGWFWLVLAGSARFGSDTRKEGCGVVDRDTKKRWTP